MAATKYLLNLGLKPWIYENPQKYEPLWFEKIDGNELRYWTRQQFPFTVVICMVYFLFIHYGPLWMKNRKPFNLQTPLVIWNFLLAIFSIFGAIRMGKEFIHTLGENGFHRSACGIEGGRVNYTFTFWAFAFTISKIPELGDTLFIVLRKKPLIFLHWFHHSTVILCSFFTYTEGEQHSLYPGLINFSVHSIMYSYYTVKALQIRVPKTISVGITSIQILQFVALLSINLYTLISYVSGGDCYRTANSLLFQFGVQSSYLYLFSKLFYNSYINKPKKQI